MMPARQGAARAAARTLLALFLFFAAAGWVAPTSAPAATFDQAEGDIDRKLEASLRELAALRERITDEKIPLSKEIAGLEREVLALRRENDRLFKLRDDGELALSKLENQVKSLQDQDDFIESRLNEFVRDFEGRLHVSELPALEATTAAAKRSEKDASLDVEQRRVLQLDVVTAAVERLDRQIGGDVFDGEALSNDGVLTAGRYISFGPTVFFANEEGSVTGLAEAKLNAADPVVAKLPSGHAEGIAAIARGETGTLPFDATLGKALKKERAQKSLIEYVEDGGAVGYIIVALGVSALLLTAFKLFEILRFQTAAPEQVDGVLEQLARGDAEAAAAEARKVEGAAGELLETGVEHASRSRGVLEELLFEKILKARPTLERFLPFLAITAGAAPLLGLLGTVSGMIETFQLITIFGTGDARNLSSGISEALVTTAMGLIVAIPTLILHGALSRMAKRKLTLLEQLSVAFVSGVAMLRPEAEA